MEKNFYYQECNCCIQQDSSEFQVAVAQLYIFLKFLEDVTKATWNSEEPGAANMEDMVGLSE